MPIEDLRLIDDEASLLTIYGNPGVGKTVAAARMAPKSLFLTDENGWKVLRENHPDLYKRIIPMRYTGLNSFKTAIKAIKEEPDASQYQLVVDTLTGMQRKKIDEVMSDSSIGIKREYKDIPSLQDYLLSQRLWTPLVSAFATCGVNVTILTHLRLLPAPEKVRPGDTVRPDLTDAVFKVVNAHSNVVAYMSKDSSGNKRMFTTQGNARLTAKDQTSPEAKDIPDDTFIDRVLKSRGY